MTAVLNNARADWYYHGQSVATPDWGETPFVKVSDDEYYVILDVNDNSGFVLKNGDASQWIGAAATLKGEDGKYHITPGMEFEISGDKVDGVIEKAGKYKMTFYPKEMKAVLATAEPEYYYHGQSKRTPNWGAVPFEKVSDEEYYVILEVEAGYGFVLKTADESSWFGAAASGKGDPSAGAFKEQLSVPIKAECELGPNWGYWSGDIYEQMKAGNFDQAFFNKDYKETH